MPAGISVGSIYAEAELDISKFEAAVGSLEAGTERIVSAMADGASAARGVGSDFAAGLAEGILAGRSGVVNAARAVAASAASAARATLQIHSPSRVTEGFGEFFDLGFVRGVERRMPAVERAVREALAVRTPVGTALARRSEAVAAGDAPPSPQAVGAQARDAVRPIVMRLDGREVARVNSDNTARAQNARARNLALRYGFGG